MDYREIAPPPRLAHLVKLGWTLAVPARAGDWVTHTAVPDGCMEVIRRVSGRSDWNGDQPACFAAGLITRPARLRLGPGSRFVGLRIWPWTWAALGHGSPAGLTDRWAALGDDDFPMALEEGFDWLEQRCDGAPSPAFVAALLASAGSGEMSRRTGLHPRGLQRWFAANVGRPPRSWLRLLRFSDAFATLPTAGATLAGHAVDHGFADQAHMARDFRSLAGTPASRARKRAHGPFIGEDADRG